MPTRNELKELAKLRLREAETLFNAGLYDGSAYLCGYVTEFALNLTTKKALKHLIPVLRNNLSREVLRRIIRLTVLKTDDPFTKGMNRAFDVRNSEKYIRSSVVSGIYIENAIIFKSASVPSVVKVGHKKNSQDKMVGLSAT